MAAPDGKFHLNLNLLFPQGIPEKLPVRFLKWLLSYGRFMAIAVEVLVMATFVMRFKYDSDLGNLKENINKQIPFIESFSQDEASIKQTQFKLATISKTYSTNPDWKSFLGKISNQVPSGVKLTSISLDHSSPSTTVSFKINGQSNSNNDLATLIGGLKLETSFKDITLTNISFDQGVIVFNITGSTK